MDPRRPLAAVTLALIAFVLLPASADAKVVWLCKPGQKANPCEPSLTTTNFSPTGKRLGVEHVQRAKRRRADCFYVYPTVSDQKQPQATQVVDDVLRSIVLYQTARYSRDCRVFAPVYRQVTIQGLFQPGTVTPQMREQGYDDVLEAWRTYLRRYNHGRGVVLIGHSQGTFVLRRLIREEIDPKAAARRRLVSAVLLGGNVTVRKGSDRGGDFKRVRACRRAGQIGCVVAFSTFNAPVPDERALRAHERARARDPLHEPGRARGRLREDHADLPECPVRGQRDRRRGQLRPPGVPAPEDSVGRLPGRLQREVLARRRGERAPGEAAARCVPVHAHAGRHLGSAPGRRQHRARRAGGPGQAPDSRFRLGSTPHLFVYGVLTPLDDRPMRSAILDMAHYLCPNCDDVVDVEGTARVTWCSACGQPLSMFDLLPVRPAIKVESTKSQEDMPPALA